MRNRLYIVSLVVMVMQTVAIFYASISANSSTITAPSLQDSISQQLDTLLPADVKPAPIKKESIKSSQKSIKQEVKTEKAIDIRLDLSAKNDTKESQTNDSVSPDTCAGPINIITPDISEEQIQEYADKDVPKVLSEWAFPLIIMLFAFGFPFMFNVITRIEEKYNSEEISASIRKSKTYIFYIASLVLALGSATAFCIMMFLCAEQSATKIIVWIAIVGICSVVLIFATFLLIYKMFTYSNASTLFKENRSKLEKESAPNNIIRITLALYHFALLHEMKDLLHTIENSLNAHMQKIRIAQASEKFKNRYDVTYPVELLETLDEFYENILKTGFVHYQNRVSRLYCELLLEKMTINDNLPKTIVSESTLEHIWKIAKLAIEYKADSAFSIIWDSISNYYKQLNINTTMPQSLIKEKANICDLCFVIGALNYSTKSYANLQYMLTVDLKDNEDLFLSHIEDVILQYYRCTGDIYSQVSRKFDAYIKYPVVTTKTTTKKQRIAPLVEYASFLIHRIYNIDKHFLQFDPFELSRKLFGDESGQLYPTQNLEESLENFKGDDILAEYNLNVKKKMLKEDIIALRLNIQHHSQIEEENRLMRAPISNYKKNDFAGRFRIELLYMTSVVRNLCKKSKDVLDPNSHPLFNNKISVLCKKKYFVYASNINAEDNQYAAAKQLAHKTYIAFVRRITELLLLIKKKRNVLAKDKLQLREKIDYLIGDGKNWIIVYFSSKDDPENIVDTLLKCKDYKLDRMRGQYNYRGAKVFRIVGSDLNDEQYQELRRSFLVINEVDLPKWYSKAIVFDDICTIKLEDVKDEGSAMLDISVETDAILSYCSDKANLIRLKF